MDAGYCVRDWRSPSRDFGEDRCKVADIKLNRRVFLAADLRRPCRLPTRMHLRAIAAQPSKSMAGDITVAVMAGDITVAEVITMDGVEATAMDEAIITVSENITW
jgi:hypothetical protein